jgi:hypothetical protein
MMMIFIEVNSSTTILDSIYYRTLNNYDAKFWFGIVKKIITKHGYHFLCDFTSFGQGDKHC